MHFLRIADLTMPGRALTLSTATDLETPMRRYIIAAAAFAALLVAPHITEAGSIIYSIQNYPADQSGATLSGTITTDGIIGKLATSDILSWSWTITSPGVTAFTLSSSDTSAQAFVDGLVVASQSNITIAASSPTAANSLGFQGAAGAELDYFRFGTSNSYQGFLPTGAVWVTPSPVMGQTNPWVVAVAAQSVPEPSCLALGCLGAACSIAGVLSRKFRARREAVNKAQE